MTLPRKSSSSRRRESFHGILQSPRINFQYSTKLRIQHARSVGATNRVDLFGTLQENECWPRNRELQVRLRHTRDTGRKPYIAVTLYADATSFAASTSHLTKFTLGYSFASASNVGAMAWQGPHLVESRLETVNRSGRQNDHQVAWKSITCSV